MESQLEKISAVECRVRVQIPWEAVSPRLNAKVRDLQRKAKLPGFRPGKVPAQMIERLFGKSVREELARELVEETFQSAVLRHQKVPLLGRPHPVGACVGWGDRVGLRAWTFRKTPR